VLEINIPVVVFNQCAEAAVAGMLRPNLKCLKAEGFKVVSPEIVVVPDDE
jgi:hypothetical protein